MKFGLVPFSGSSHVAFSIFWNMLVKWKIFLIFKISEDIKTDTYYGILLVYDVVHSDVKFIIQNAIVCE